MPILVASLALVSAIKAPVAVCHYDFTKGAVEAARHHVEEVAHTFIAIKWVFSLGLGAEVWKVEPREVSWPRVDSSACPADIVSKDEDQLKTANFINSSH